MYLRIFGRLLFGFYHPDFINVCLSSEHEAPPPCQGGRPRAAGDSYCG